MKTYLLPRWSVAVVCLAAASVPAVVRAARVDAQVGELAAKRATMVKNAVDTKDWDLAMKEMGAARDYLRSVGEEIRQATRDTWAQQKEKVGLAWIRTQEAYAKVKASTTS